LNLVTPSFLIHEPGAALDREIMGWVFSRDLMKCSPQWPAKDPVNLSVDLDDLDRHSPSNEVRRES